MSNNQISEGTAQSRRIGIIAIILTWLTGPISVPVVKILKNDFSSEELLFVRSIFGCIMTFAMVGRLVWSSARGVKYAGAIIGLSSIAFYRALQSWDVNSVMMIITLLPVVNITFAIKEGRRLSPVIIVSFIVLVYGIVKALDLHGRAINFHGLCWSLSCIIIGGTGFELLSKSSEQVTLSETCFWLSFPVLVFSSVIILMTQLPIAMGKYLEPRSLGLLLVIGVVGGIVYAYSNFTPFNRVGRMNIVAASVLLQGTTPCTMVGSYFIAHEVLSLSQKIGVAIALVGAACLSGFMAWKPRNS